MAGKARPRPWAPLDVDYLVQDTIAELRCRFGPAGPTAFLALILEAHKQGSAGGRGGRVRMRYTALARLTGCTADEARGIVGLAVELGLLALVPGDDSLTFEAVMVKARAWEPKDPGAALRQARRRANEAS